MTHDMIEASSVRTAMSVRWTNKFWEYYRFSTKDIDGVRPTLTTTKSPIFMISKEKRSVFTFEENRRTSGLSR